MKGRPIHYGAEEMAWLAENRTLPIGDYADGFNAAFKRDVSAQNLHALRKRNGWKTGRTGCFAKGDAPHNKGRPHPTRGRGVETQFKRGGLPHNTKFLGHERLSKDGYWEVSVAQTNPHTGYERRYVLKHVHEWEKVNGPIPKGQCLKSRDGNRSNADPANWQLIPRALLPRLNGGRHKRRPAYDEASPEIRPALLTAAKIEHRAHQLRTKRKAGAS